MLRHVQHDGWRKWLASVLFVLLFALPVHAQTLPKLTGRVVDTAGLLSPEQSAALDTKLAALEQSSGHQLVVATIPNLQGYPIEDYGNRLLRTWALGSKEKDDGAILLVAKDDRKVRIEVGYGLEPYLTDAYSSVIINSTIVPRFKAGDYAGGIDAGVDAIAEQVKLPPEQAAARAQQVGVTANGSKGSGGWSGGALLAIILFFFVILPLLRGARGGRRYRRGSGLGEVILWSAINAAVNSRGSDGGGWGGGGGSGGGFGGGGGFSGGVGSGGGGGASGGW